jgi:hypothetical protein
MQPPPQCLGATQPAGLHNTFITDNELVIFFLQQLTRRLAPLGRDGARWALLLLLACGQTALLQGVAWTSMLATRAPSRGFSEAVSSTFSGAEPCALCCRLRQADEAPPTAPQPGDPTKKLAKDGCLDLSTRCIAPRSADSARTLRRHGRPPTQTALHGCPPAPEPPPPRAS